MKKYFFIIALILILSTLTGCIKTDKMDDINIVTTIYPIEYVTNRLYGDNSTVKSIYPINSVVNTYKITTKQLKDYSENDLFIYNGESNERRLATEMLKYNKNLKIIDAAYGLDAENKPSDIWLNPSNMLMISQNIKDELTDYIYNKQLIKKVNDKYELLKVDITELETEFKKTADNSENTKIIVADESLNFLQKYGFEIINLTKDGKNKEDNIDIATALLKDETLSYIFIMENGKKYDIVEKLKTNLDVETLEFRTLDTITEKDVTANDDYISIMHSNIELLKKETYK